MPELPEVETVLRTLEGQIKDLQITSVDVLWDNIIVDDVQDFKNKIVGQHFRKFKRRGKYLLFEMDDICLVSHLRMEGKYFIQKPDVPLTKHMHVIFGLDNGLQLRYNDTRKFGKMELIPLDYNYKKFKNLGVEPLSDDLNFAYVKQYINNIKHPIKQTLLDQSFIAGIGNIYADEILFRMKVNPSRTTSDLNDQEIEDLVKYTKYILQGAIKAGGTTIRSYTSSLGVTGRFQLELKVHQRKDEKCYVCNSTIVKTQVSKRGTYYCPKCQKD